MVVKTISGEMFWIPKVSCLPKQEKGDSYTNTPHSMLTAVPLHVTMSILPLFPTVS